MNANRTFVAAVVLCWVSTAFAQDFQPPTAPTSLTVTNLTSTSCTLTWSGATDNVGVTSYRVMINPGPMMNVSTASANVTGLMQCTNYTVQIQAFDAAGNMSPQSQLWPFTTPPNTPEINPKGSRLDI